MRKKSGELVAVAGNEVFRQSCSMTVPELRLAIWLVCNVEPFMDTQFTPQTLSVDSFAKLAGLEKTSGSYYELLKAVVDRFMTRVLTLPTPTGWKKFNWLSMAQYHKGEGKMTLRLNSELHPYMLDLKGLYAQIPMSDMMRLSGEYAILFFQYACTWSGSDKRNWQMTVPELRTWLAIKPGTIQRVQDLKKDVIGRAKAELDKKSSVSFDFEDLKQGRKIVGWRFFVLDLPEKSAHPPAPKTEESPPVATKKESKPRASKDQAQAQEAVRQAAISSGLARWQAAGAMGQAAIKAGLPASYLAPALWKNGLPGALVCLQIHESHAQGQELLPLGA